MYGLTHNDFPIQSWQQGYGSEHPPAVFEEEVVTLEPGIPSDRLDSMVGLMEPREKIEEQRIANIPFTVDPQFPLAEKIEIQRLIDQLQGEPPSPSGFRPPQPTRFIQLNMANKQSQYDNMVARTPELADRSIPCVSLEWNELIELKRKGEIDKRTFDYCIRRKSADTLGYSPS